MRSALSFARMSLAAALLAAGADVRAEPVKVAVVPFAPLTGDVPVRAGGKGAMLLAGELKNVGELAPIELAIEADEASAKALQEARAAVTAAQKLESKRRFGAAAAAYRQALAKYAEAADQIADINELSDVYVALATVLYLTGDDAGGEKELWQAISLTPKRELQGEKTSKLFTATVASVRAKVLAASKASLEVASVPAGAQVLLDGREMGRTPLTIRDLPPGLHLWRVLLPTSEPAGGAVTLSAGDRQKVSAAISGASPVTRLNALLATNKLDETAIALAKEASAAAGDAELVVFGALLGRGEELVLESFLYSSSKNALTRLPSKTFDAELISAGMELFNVATEIGGRLQTLGTEEKLPGKVSLEAPPAEAAERTEIAFKLPGEGEEQQKSEESKGGRRPLDPHKTQRVLKPRDK